MRIQVECNLFRVGTTRSIGVHFTRSAEAGTISGEYDEGRTTITLLEAIEQLDTSDEEWVICAALIDGEWKEASACYLGPDPDENKTVHTFDGIEMKYVLEVFLAREILEDWLEISYQASLTLQEKFRVVVYYASHDCWPDPKATATESQ